MSPPRVTNYPAIKNAPLIGLAEGNGSFSNIHLAILVITTPYILKSFLPLFNRGGFKTYLFLLVLTGIPTTIAYWTVMSTYGPRKNERVVLPGNPVDTYITIKDQALKETYKGQKIPMQIFHDAYFDGKVDFNGEYHVVASSYHANSPIRIATGDVLDIMEQRHDWAKFNFTPALFKYVFLDLIPQVVVHSQNQDEEQVRGHYDRT